VAKAKLTNEQILANAMLHISQMKKLTGDEAKAYEEYEQKKVATAKQSGDILGKFAAESLTGQKNAWKGALGSIIDMIAKQTEAGIISYAHVAAMAHLASTAGYDVAGAAAIEVMGAAGAAAVGGLAAAAKSGLDSSGGGETLSAPSTVTSSAANRTSNNTGGSPAGKQGPQISLIVQGNILGEQHYVQNTLLPLLSSAVEDYGGRLISSGQR
jgi:hypothetical protein